MSEGLFVITFKSKDVEKEKAFSSGEMASGHLPLVRHAHTDNCKISIMIYIYVCVCGVVLRYLAMHIMYLCMCVCYLLRV